MTTKSADYCMVVNEWAWLTSQVCLLRLEVHFGSVLESELGQTWRYNVLKVNRLKLVSSEKSHGLKYRKWMYNYMEASTFGQLKSC